MFVAADPYGEVGNAGQPDLGPLRLYRHGRDREAAGQPFVAARRLPELRDAAQGRYWEWAAVLAHAEGEEELPSWPRYSPEAEQRGRRQALARARTHHDRRSGSQ